MYIVYNIKLCLYTINMNLFIKMMMETHVNFSIFNLQLYQLVS